MSPASSVFRLEPIPPRHKTPARHAGSLLALAFAALLGGCTLGPRPVPSGTVPPERALNLAFPVEPGQTFDLAQGRPLPAEALERRLRGTHRVFLGENHEEPRSHAFELEVLRLLADQGRPVVVALEMFPPSVDPVLEDWRQGRLDELAFLERSDWYRHWGFPWAYYRPVFLFLREQRLPVHGVNAEPDTRKAVREGKLENLSAALRADIGDLDEPIDPHFRYVLETLRAVGHGGNLAPDSPQFQRIYRVQRLWDRLMGLRAARLEAETGPDGVVALLIGSGHLAWRLGANLQAARVDGRPGLTLWDTVADPSELDGQGRYAVPLGLADLVRVYVQEKHPVVYPVLRGLELEQAPEGVRVKALRLSPKSALAVLKARDVIVALNGAPVRSPTALRLAYEGLPFGRQVAVTVLRAGKREDLAFQLSAPPGH